MPDNPDPWQDPGWLRYAAHMRDEVLPTIKSSAVTLAMVEGRDPDPQQACELGMMILLDKPIIAVVLPGVKVPNKLMRVADEIVEGLDMNDEGFKKRMVEAIARVQAKLGLT